MDGSPGDHAANRFSAKLLVCCALFLVVTSGVFGGGTAESGSAGDPDTILEESGYPAEDIAVLRETLTHARSVGVPEGMLADRLQEGISKRVDSETLAQALQTNIGYLLHSRDILILVPDGQLLIDDPACWERAAHLLQTGQPESILESLARLTTNPPVFRPATSLFVSLVAWGLAPEQALALVTTVVHSDLQPEEYADVTALLAQAQQARMDVEDATTRIIDLLEEGRTLSQISAVLK